MNTTISNSTGASQDCLDLLCKTLGFITSANKNAMLTHYARRKYFEKEIRILLLCVYEEAQLVFRIILKPTTGQQNRVEPTKKHKRNNCTIFDHIFLGRSATYRTICWRVPTICEHISDCNQKLGARPQEGLEQDFTANPRRDPP